MPLPAEELTKRLRPPASPFYPPPALANICGAGRVGRRIVYDDDANLYVVQAARELKR